MSGPGRSTSIDAAWPSARDQVTFGVAWDAVTQTAATAEP